jgi:hypothetical protein
MTRPDIDCSHWRSVRRNGIGHCHNPDSSVRLPTYEQCLRHCVLYDGKLAGNQIEKVLATIGVKKVVEAIIRKRPCRCKERRDKINQLHRERKLRRIGSPVGDGG